MNNFYAPGELVYNTTLQRAGIVVKVEDLPALDLHVYCYSSGYWRITAWFSCLTIPFAKYLKSKA